MPKPAYQVCDKKDSKQLAQFLSQEGQLLLPMLDLITQAEMAVDELIDVAGRAAIEAVLQMSAQELAGPKHQGQRGGEIHWHGRQKGVVPLAERKLRVDRPRLRRKGPGGQEVDLPAYQAMLANGRLGTRLVEILMSNVSTRQYAKVLPQMAQTVGVSKSQVSREFVEASEKQLQQLCERRLDDRRFLVVYLDGIQFGTVHVLVAIGVDHEGYKRVLGLREGASENGVIAKDLLTDLAQRGLAPQRRYLFVVDGSKALRQAIDRVFGRQNPVQRCRNHKIENVMGYLPEDQHEQVKAAMKAAFALEAKEGLAKLEHLARWLEREHPSAAASLREGLAEMFTINRLGLPRSLRRCLGTTNVIESPNSGLRDRTRRVKHWQDASMVLRWAAAALLDTEKGFRRLMGYRDLWMLQTALDEHAEDASDKTVASKDKVA
jgi:transposase-like protein